LCGGFKAVWVAEVCNSILSVALDNGLMEVGYVSLSTKGPVLLGSRVVEFFIFDEQSVVFFSQLRLELKVLLTQWFELVL
jgi:hypothetical protein